MTLSRPEAGQRLPDIPLPASSLTFGPGWTFLFGEHIFLTNRTPCPGPSR